MVLEDFIKKLSEPFLDNDLAFYKLDSIAYSVSEISSGQSRLMEDLQRICQIGLLYGGEQLRVLQIFDEVYGKAVNNPNSVLFRYYKRERGASPVKEISMRLKQYNEEYGKLIDLDSFKIITEQETLFEIRLRGKEIRKDRKFKKRHVVRSKRHLSSNYLFVF